jgi:hypothetical protein
MSGYTSVASTNASYPFIDKASILSGAQVVCLVSSAWKDKIIKRSTSTLQPSQHARLRRSQKLKLNRSTSFLLNDYSAIFDAAATCDIAYSDLDDIAAP